MNISINLENYIQSIYDNEDFRIIDNHNIDDLHNLNLTNLEVLNSFHARTVLKVERDDNYFCGIRANHFAIEVGWSESLLEDDSTVYVVTANHKGVRVVTVFVDWYKE